MIMYSIIPNEIIFKNTEENFENNYLEMDYLGERVQVTASVDNKFIINRIISTSPKAYLNPNLQPGSKIEGIAKIVKNY
jgi:hypothetical protein